MKKFLLIGAKSLIQWTLAVVGFIFINSYIPPTQAEVEVLGNESRKLSERTINASLDVPFQLKIGQTAFIDSEELGIKFIGVPVDSRCPINVFCVWAGEILIELGVVKDRTVAHLSFGYGLVSNGFDTDFDGYSIKLLRIEPERVLDFTPLDQTLKSASEIDPDSGITIVTINQPDDRFNELDLRLPQPKDGSFSSSSYVVTVVVSKKN